MNNILTQTDVYKLGHMEQYPEGTTKVYSYLCARSTKYFDETVFFGLQYYLKEYLSKPITHQDVDELLRYRKAILKTEASEDVVNKYRALADLGYWPIKIKAVDEGTVINNKNVLMTIENTHPDFYWCVGYIESLILKLWFPCTVATLSRKYRKLVDEVFDKAVDENKHFLKDFMVHDFGYRGDTSEESAKLSSMAHLINFRGSDSVVALPSIERYYECGTIDFMDSVPASEHSVMCAFGLENEIDAYKHMLKLYPEGIVSIVSDTYNLWNVLQNIAGELKEEILNRNGKVVFRPDSGNPKDIICGDVKCIDKNNVEAFSKIKNEEIFYNYTDGHYYQKFIKDNKEERFNTWSISKVVPTPENLGAIKLLDKMFGHTVNSKGYKVLNQKVGLIYGDGMYYDRYKETLELMMEQGWSPENLVIGIGGILRNHTRDTLGFAIKATYVEVGGEPKQISKDPITDPGKKSHIGKMILVKKDNYFQTVDGLTDLSLVDVDDILKVKFKDGKLYNQIDFEILKENASKYTEV